VRWRGVGKEGRSHTKENGSFKKIDPFRFVVKIRAQHGGWPVKARPNCSEMGHAHHPTPTLSC